MSLTHEQGFAAAVVVADDPDLPIRSQMIETDSPGRSASMRACPSTSSTLADDADLYQAGMTSHASVNVMLALEDAFDIEFPDRMLKRSVFESIAAIAAALTELQAEIAA